MIKSKPLRILLLYYVFLGVSSLVLSLMGIHPFKFSFGGSPSEFIPMWIPIIAGGLVALKLTVSAQAFRVFVIIYSILWVLRFLLLYVGNKVGDVVIAGREFHFEHIFSNYYKNVSALDSHLPFVLYWFIIYLFTIATKQQGKQDPAEEIENKGSI